MSLTALPACVSPGTASYAFACPPSVCDAPPLPPPPPPPPCRAGTPDPDAQVVALADILRDPEPWIGRHVRVRAIPSMQFEQELLFDPAAPHDAARFSFARELHGDLAACDRHLVILDGQVGRTRVRGRLHVEIHSIRWIRGMGRR